MAEPRKVLIAVDPLLWQEVKDFGRREGRTLTWVVGHALERLIRNGIGPIVGPQDTEVLTARVNAALEAKGIGGLKTAKQLIEEREGQRGDETNQERYRDDPDHTF